MSFFPQPAAFPSGPTPPAGPAPAVSFVLPLPGQPRPDQANPPRGRITAVPAEVWRNMAEIIVAANVDLPGRMHDLRNLASTCRRLRNKVSLAHYIVAKEVCPDLLSFGAWRGDLNILKLGLDAGADINSRACRRRVLRTYCDFVSNRTMDTRRDIMQSMSATPLHWAIVMGHSKALQLLLGYNTRSHAGIVVRADLHATCRRMCKCWFSGTNVLPNFTPLHLAICQGNSKAAVQLLRAGATLAMYDPPPDNDVPANDPQISALHTAARHGLTGHGLLDQIMQHQKADINVWDGKGWTPLHYACRREAAYAAPDRHPQVEWDWHAAPTPTSGCVRELIRLGADVNLVDNNGITVLESVLESGFWEVAHTLLDVNGITVESIRGNPIALALSRAAPVEGLNARNNTLQAWQDARAAIIRRLRQQHNVDLHNPCTNQPGAVYSSPTPALRSNYPLSSAIYLCDWTCALELLQLGYNANVDPKASPNRLLYVCARKTFWKSHDDLYGKWNASGSWRLRRRATNDTSAQDRYERVTVAMAHRFEADRNQVVSLLMAQGADWDALNTTPLNQDHPDGRHQEINEQHETALMAAIRVGNFGLANHMLSTPPAKTSRHPRHLIQGVINNRFKVVGGLEPHVERTVLGTNPQLLAEWLNQRTTLVTELWHHHGLRLGDGYRDWIPDGAGDDNIQSRYWNGLSDQYPLPAVFKTLQKNVEERSQNVVGSIFQEVEDPSRLIHDLFIQGANPNDGVGPGDNAFTLLHALVEWLETMAATGMCDPRGTPVACIIEILSWRGPQNERTHIPLSLLNRLKRLATPRPGQNIQEQEYVVTLGNLIHKYAATRGPRDRTSKGITAAMKETLRRHMCLALAQDDFDFHFPDIPGQAQAWLDPRKVERDRPLPGSDFYDGDTSDDTEDATFDDDATLDDGDDGGDDSGGDSDEDEDSELGSGDDDWDDELQGGDYPMQEAPSPSPSPLPGPGPAFSFGSSPLARRASSRLAGRAGSAAAQGDDEYEAGVEHEMEDAEEEEDDEDDEDYRMSDDEIPR